LALRVQS